MAIVRLTKAEAAPTNSVANKLAKKAAKAAVDAAGADGGAVDAAGDGGAAGVPAAAPPGQAPAAAPTWHRLYLEAHHLIMGELLGWTSTEAQQDHGDSRWLLMCDAGPRGLLPRSHLP